MRTKSSDHCGFEFRRPTSARPRRSGETDFFADHGGLAPCKTLARRKSQGDQCDCPRNQWLGEKPPSRKLQHHDNLQEIEYAAINGLLSTLDPHSVLLRPSEYREMKLSTRGRFGGLGIVISLEDGRLTVVRPIPDTPAARAGTPTLRQASTSKMDNPVQVAMPCSMDSLGLWLVARRLVL